MAAVITCPTCEHRFPFGALGTGGNVQCPACNAVCNPTAIPVARARAVSTSKALPLGNANRQKANHRDNQDSDSRQPEVTVKGGMSVFLILGLAVLVPGMLFAGVVAVVIGTGLFDSPAELDTATVAVAPKPKAPVPDESVPVSPAPFAPVPGNPDPGSPVPGNPDPGSPVPVSPIPGNPTPVSPVPIGPFPGNPFPGYPVPGVRPLEQAAPDRTATSNLSFEARQQLFEELRKQGRPVAVKPESQFPFLRPGTVPPSQMGIGTGIPPEPVFPRQIGVGIPGDPQTQPESPPPVRRKAKPVVPVPPPGPEPVMTVVRTVPVTATDLAYDPIRGCLYAAVGSTATKYANSVVAIDPAAGKILWTADVRSDPGTLALAQDGSALWVGLRGAACIQRVNVAKKAAGPLVPLKPGRFGPDYAEQIIVLPGTTDSLVISLFSKSIPRHQGVVVFDEGIPRPGKTQGHTGANRITKTDDPAVLVGFNNESTEFGLRVIDVTDDGVKERVVYRGAIQEDHADIAFAAGRVYATTGAVVDAK
ncbi:MAG: hypothetical protein ACRC7O_01865, partial [Fimbriiglobus sp.]